MGSRRLGRKRINALNKVGESVVSTAGDGIKDAIVSETVRREGLKVITEIAVDLGTSKATIASVATDLDIIGVDTAANAALTQLDPAVHGYITYVEMACVEVPAGGTLDIDLYLATEVSATERQGYAIGSATETALITAGGNWALGEIDHYAVAHGTAHDIEADSKGLYLVSGEAANAGDYTAGKFVITLEGWLAPDDI